MVLGILRALARLFCLLDFFKLFLKNLKRLDFIGFAGDLKNNFTGNGTPNAY